MKIVWRSLLGVLCVAVVAAILFPVFAVPGTGHHRPPVMSHMKQLATGSLIYASDHDELFPPADRWMTATLPVVKNEFLYDDPSLDSGRYGFAFYTPSQAFPPSKSRTQATFHLSSSPSFSPPTPTLTSGASPQPRERVAANTTSTQMLTPPSKSDPAPGPPKPRPSN
jgi:hypothetical protein